MQTIEEREVGGGGGINLLRMSFHSHFMLEELELSNGCVPNYCISRLNGVFTFKNIFNERSKLT